MLPDKLKPRPLVGVFLFLPLHGPFTLAPSSTVYTAGVMDGPSPGFPFRWFLPMIQLLACIILLQPYWSSLRVEVSHLIVDFQQSLFGGQTVRPAPAMILNVVPDTAPEPIDPRLTLPAALNLPVGCAQLPITFLSGQTEWVPEGMLVHEWRALSWPFVGMFFWWLAGRGLEAFGAAVSSRRFAIIRPPLHWAEVVVAACLFVFGAGSGLLFAWGRNPTGLITDRNFAVGAGLWALLGGVTVAARLFQWQIRRRARAEKVAYAP